MVVVVVLVSGRAMLISRVWIQVVLPLQLLQILQLLQLLQILQLLQLLGLL